MKLKGWEQESSCLRIIALFLSLFLFIRAFPVIKFSSSNVQQVNKNNKKLSLRKHTGHIN